MEKEKAAGTKLIGILALTYGIHLTVLNIYLFNITASAVVGVVFGIVMVVSGAFLCIFKNWARLLLIWWAALWAIFFIPLNPTLSTTGLLSGSNELLRWALLKCIPCLIAAVYLTRPGVKEQFKKGGK